MSGAPDKPLEDYPQVNPADLPLPPPDDPFPSPAAEAAPSPAPEVARLQFLDPDSVRKDIPLAHPFVWEGAPVRSIVVKRLTIAEVGAIFQRVKRPELFDFYAAMTGLPAPVLRGLMDDDGDAVIAACAPFLPQIVQAWLSGPTPASGDATPSP